MQSYVNTNMGCFPEKTTPKKIQWQWNEALQMKYYAPDGIDTLRFGVPSIINGFKIDIYTDN